MLLIAANISYIHNKNKPKEEIAQEELPEKVEKPKKRKYIIEKVDTVKAKSKKKPRKKVAQVQDIGYNKNTKEGIYNFMMRDDFGIKLTDKVDDNESIRETKKKHND